MRDLKIEGVNCFSKITPSLNDDRTASIQSVTLEKRATRYSHIIRNILMVVCFILGFTGIVLGGSIGLGIPIGLALYSIGFVLMFTTTLLPLAFLILRKLKCISGGSSDSPPGSRIGIATGFTNESRLRYIKDNIENILCNHQDIHLLLNINPSQSDILPYREFSFKEYNNKSSLNKDCSLVYKLSSFPCNQKDKTTSYLEYAYQAHIKAKQAIQNATLDKLMITGMGFQRIKSSIDNLSYDLIIEHKRQEGYVNLDESTSHLLSEEVIKQLTTFVCLTGFRIDWHNIFINLESPDKIYLSDLGLSVKGMDDDFDGNSPSRIVSSLFGDSSYNRGLIHCLASLDDIKISIDTASHFNIGADLENNHRTDINRRLSSREQYEKLCSIDKDDIVITSSKSGHKKLNLQNVYYLSNNNNDLLSEDTVVRLDTSANGLFYFPMSNLVSFLKDHPEECLDNGSQLVLSHDVEYDLKQNLPEIIDNDSNVEGKVNYLHTNNSEFDPESCVFTLNKHPELVFKVYKKKKNDKDRKAANELAEQSYDNTVLFNQIIKDEKLDLLIQPKRKLLELRIGGDIYKVIVSKINKIEGQELNLGKIHDIENKEVIKQLIKLLSRKWMHLNSYSALLFDDHDGSKKMMLVDVPSERKVGQPISYSAIQDVLMFVPSDNEVLQNEMFSYGIKSGLFGNFKDTILSAVLQFRNKLSSKSFMYYRAKYFLSTHHHHPILNEGISITSLSEQGVLDTNLNASSSSLSQDYFMRSNVSSLSMRDALKDIIKELKRIIISKQSVNDLVLRRTISLDDIESSRVLKAYSKVYSNSGDKMSWLTKVMNALIAGGYACRGSSEGDICL